MKKIMLLFLILSTLSLFSCAGEEKPTVSPESDDEEEISFYGYNCLMTQKLYFADSSGDLMYYKEGTGLADLARQRLADIGEKYDCNINTEYLSSDTGMAQRLTAAMASARTDTDIALTVQLSEQHALVYGDCLVPLTELNEWIDYTDAEKYSPLNLLELAMRDGIPYMVAAYALPENQALSLLPLSVFNSELMKSNNLTDVRELYEKGAWTWDGFENYLRDYTLTEGEQVISAFTLIEWEHVLYGAMNSNGVQAVVKKDGEYVSGINCPETVTAIEWVQKLKNEYSDCIRRNPDWVKIDTDLEEDATMLIMTEIDMLFSDIAFRVDDFGIAPFPCGPSGEYGKSSSGSSIKGYGVAQTAADSEVAAQILSLMLEPFEEYPDTDSIKTYYLQVFHDPRDIDVYYQIGENATHMYVEEGGLDFFISAAKALSSKSAIEIIEAYQGSFEKTVNEYIAPNRKGMDELK